MFETVLFPLDQSRQTMETAAVVLQLAQRHGSRVVLLQRSRDWRERAWREWRDGRGHD